MSGQLKRITVSQQKIVLNCSAAPPIHSAPYQADLEQQKLERKEAAQVKKAVIAEPVVTECALPIVFVPKKDKTLRFCIDYRRLNAVTERDSHPILRIDKCVDSLGEEKMFSTLDANPKYWQIVTDKKNVESMAFVAYTGSTATPKCLLL